MGPASVIILCVFLAVVAAAIFYILITRVQATRLGLPPPPITSYIPFWPERSNSLPYANNTSSSSSSSGGIKGWFGKFKKNNSRTAAGAYEPSGGNPNAARSRGFGPLDPDEAWDARVGHEADGYGPTYYEETEMQPPRHNNLGDDTSYGGSSYQMNIPTNPDTAQPGTSNPFADPDEVERGRRRSRSPGPVANKGLSAPVSQNPFDDAAADSGNAAMRGVSPRPIEGSGTSKPSGHNNGEPESPAERRSIFREDV